MIRTQVNLREDQYRELRFQSKEEGESFSELLRQVIDRYLPRQRKEGNASILLRMAKKAVATGKDRSLSIAYKRHLYNYHP